MCTACLVCLIWPQQKSLKRLASTSSGYINLKLNLFYVLWYLWCYPYLPRPPWSGRHKEDKLSRSFTFAEFQANCTITWGTNNGGKTLLLLLSPFQEFVSTFLSKETNSGAVPGRRWHWTWLRPACWWPPARPLGYHPASWCSPSTSLRSGGWNGKKIGFIKTPLTTYRLYSP